MTNLSGGECQRTALARALAVKPRVLLLDEPLSALDPCFRWDMQRLIKDLHKRLSLTCLMVTHDFGEALYLAETATVLHRGRVCQQGSVRDIFKSPKNAFVAEFTGMRNVFPVFRLGNRLRAGEAELFPGHDCGRGQAVMAVRPELLRISRNGLSGENRLEGSVTEVHDRGAYWEVVLAAGGLSWVAALSRHDFLALERSPGDAVALEVPPEALHLMEEEPS